MKVMRTFVAGLKLAFFICLIVPGTAVATSYSLTVSAQGSGTITKNPTNATDPAGVVVTITAVPDAGWYFANWSGDTNGSVNPLNVTMNSDLSITGDFLAIPAYVLTLATNGHGTIGLDPAGGSYLSNSVVTATATPAAGWVFASWSGGANGNANPLSITVNANSSLTGTFAQLPAFDGQPQGVTNIAGGTVGFTSHAVGTMPLSYQWFFSGGPLTGTTTNATLTLTNIQSTNAGNYYIIVTNNYGSATSSVVALVVTNFIGTTNVVHSADEAGLRAAIQTGGWVSIGFNGAVTIANTINITNNVVLDGSSVSATISGGNAVRLFYVAPGASLSATNLTLANGSTIVTSGTPGTPADAGAVYNNGGVVTLVSCTLTNNSAQSLIYGGLARGGVIFNNGGNVTLNQSSISNNAAIGGGPNSPTGLATTGTGLGGAIYNTNGTVTISGCNVSSNFCSGICEYNGFTSGTGLTMGGAAFQASGSMTIASSTFALNLAFGSIGVGTPATPASPAYGGAVAANGGSITIDHSQFSQNAAEGGSAGYHGAAGPAFGGAVYSAAALSVGDSSFFGNQTLAGNNTVVPTAATRGIDGSGGAIYNSGTAVLNRCSVCSNYVQGGNVIGYGSGGSPANGGNALGGGVFNASQFAATNCTIALNSSVGGGSGAQGGAMGADGNAMGGGIFNNTNATLSSMNLTIASNNCSSPSGYEFTNGIAAGSQIANTNGILRLHNSLIAYGGMLGNAFGPITDDGFNISSDGTAQLFGGSSYNYTDPKLAPLADYGGPTLCMALLAGSPAIDYADGSNFPATDQRGYVRPIGSGPDIGAYEYGSYPFLNPYLNVTPAGASVVLTFTATPAFAYRLQASTNLTIWADLNTNGPFASATNISQTISLQGFEARFFRLLVQ